MNLVKEHEAIREGDICNNADGLKDRMARLYFVKAMQSVKQ